MGLRQYLKKRDGGPMPRPLDDSRATTSLLSDTGPLGAFPDPMAAVRRDGSMVASKHAARRLAAQFTTEGPLRRAIAEAVGTREDRQETIDGEAYGGIDGTWRVKLHPMPDGETVLVHASDVTPDRTLRDTLIESRKRYKELVDISSDFVWETGPDGRFSFVSPVGALGYTADELVAQNPSEFIPEAALLGATTPLSTRSEVADVDIWFRRADGVNALLQASARPILNAQGEWIGSRGVCRNATEAHQRDAALAAAQRRERLSSERQRRAQSSQHAGGRRFRHGQGAWRDKLPHLSPCGLTVAAEHGKPPIDDGLDGKLLLQASEDGEPIMAADADRHVICALTGYRKSANGAMAVVRPLESGAWNQDDVTLVWRSRAAAGDRHRAVRSSPRARGVVANRRIVSAAQPPGFLRRPRDATQAPQTEARSRRLALRRSRQFQIGQRRPWPSPRRRGAEGGGRTADR